MARHDQIEVEPPEGSALDEIELGLEPPGAEDLAPLAWEALLPRLRRGGAPPPVPGERDPWVILAVALSGVFATSFTITVLTVSLTDIARNLGSTTSVLTWAITGSSLGMAVLGPVAGKLVDRIGARRMYRISTFASALAVGAAALAWSAGALIVFRVLGAVAGASTGPAALAIINSRFPPERRAQAMGYWSLVVAGAPVFGVIIGGPLVDGFGWRWIFIIQFPLALLSYVLGTLLLPETELGDKVRFDVTGAVTLGLGVASLLVALNRGPEIGWTTPVVVIGFLLCPLFLAAFVVNERRIDHPLLPLEYFRRRNFTFPMIQQFFAQFAYMGGFILTPLLLSEVLGYSTTKVGLVSIARPAIFSIIGPVAGYFAVKLGERTIGAAGSVVLIASMLVLATVGAGTSIFVILLGLALSGMAMGTTSPPMIASIANSVDERDLGIVSAAQMTMMQVGAAAGMQIMLTVQETRAASSGAASYSWGYLVGAAAAGISLVAALAVRSSRGQRHEPAAA